MSNIQVVIKAEEEYSRAVGIGSTPSAFNPGSAASLFGALPGGGVQGSDNGVPDGARGASLGTGFSPQDLFVSTYASRLEAERAFQLERLGIIKSANLEEFTTMGQHSDEQLSKDKEYNEIKTGNTKAMIGSSLSLMKTLMSGSKKNNKAMFEADKAYSVGKAMMSAYTSAGKAYEAYAVNPPLAALMAAMALAKGMAIVRSIASQRMTKSVSSGGGGLGGGGTPSSMHRSTAPYGSPGEGENKGTQNIVVNIHNPLSDENWAKVVEDNIIPALENAGERNVLLDINV